MALTFGLGAYTLTARMDAPILQTPAVNEVTNAEAVGLVLYTQYAFYFQVGGLILLVAMIGAIVLTLRENVRAKKQDVVAQVNRKPEEAMEVKDVTSGRGLQL